MGLELAAASMATQGLGMMAQIGAAGSSAKLAKQTYQRNLAAAQENLRLADAETARQQRDAFEATVTGKSDRIRKANDGLATLRVLTAEGGASARSMTRLFAEAGYAEGADLSRMDSNLTDQIEAGQAQKEVNRANYRNAATGAGIQLAGAKAQSQAQITSAILGFVGSGLSIGSSYYAGERRLTALENRDRR
jgi:hypothetical protein